MYYECVTLLLLEENLALKGQSNALRVEVDAEGLILVKHDVVLRQGGAQDKLIHHQLTDLLPKQVLRDLQKDFWSEELEELRRDKRCLWSRYKRAVEDWDRKKAQTDETSKTYKLALFKAKTETFLRYN